MYFLLVIGIRYPLSLAFNSVIQMFHSCFAGRTSRNAVEHLTYEQLNDKDLELRWGPPDTSDTVDKYIITVSVVGISTASRVYETTDTRYIFKDVYPCSTYSFSVDVSVTNKNYNYKAQKLKADTPNVGR